MRRPNNKDYQIDPNNFEGSLHQALEYALPNATAHAADEVCRDFAQAAQNEQQLLSVVNAYAQNTADRYRAASDLPGEPAVLARRSISKAANQTVAYFITSSLRLDLFNSSTFLEALRTTFGLGNQDAAQTQAQEKFRQSWVNVLGQYLASEPRKNRQSSWQPEEVIHRTFKNSSNSREGKQRAAHAVEQLDNAGLLWLERSKTQGDNFWFQYATRAARVSPEILPFVLKSLRESRDGAVYKAIVENQGPVTITSAYVEELLRQYADDDSRNTSILQKVLNASTPKDNYAGFELRAMIEYCDHIFTTWAERRRQAAGNKFAIPTPLLDRQGRTGIVLENGQVIPRQRTDSEPAIDFTKVSRALSRILAFSRRPDLPPEEQEIQFLIDEMHAELVGLLYGGKNLLKDQPRLNKLAHGHLGPLLMQFNVTEAEMRQYGEQLTQGQITLRALYRQLRAQGNRHEHP